MPPPLKKYFECGFDDYQSKHLHIPVYNSTSYELVSRSDRFYFTFIISNFTKQNQFGGCVIGTIAKICSILNIKYLLHLAKVPTAVSGMGSPFTFFISSNTIPNFQLCLDPVRQNGNNWSKGVKTF